MRRVASLPPISAEIFAEKVLTAQASSTAVAAKASFQKLCPSCQKIYYSQNAYDNHLKSQRHRLHMNVGEANPKEDGDTGSIISSTISLGEPINGTKILHDAKPPDPTNHIDPEAEAEFSEVVNGIKDARLSDEPVSRRPTRPHHSGGESRAEHPLSPEKSGKAPGTPPVDEPAHSTEESKSRECLFCHVICADLNLNVEHMENMHGLFIPEREYLTDLQGLYQWLWKNVNEEPYECLYCHKSRNTADAIKAHMRDLGHCKIAFEDEEEKIEVGQFYDFSSTYSDDETHNGDDEEGMGDANADEDQWEDDSQVDSDDATEELQHEGVSVAGRHAPSTRALYENLPMVFKDDLELYLPSGKVAGHRSLAKYFRQNLKTHPSPAERFERQKLLSEGHDEHDEGRARTNGRHHAESDNGETRRGRQLVSRANGGLGMLGVTDAKKREIRGFEKRNIRQAERAQRHYQWGVNKRANNQKHFRDPLLQ